jgi:hypothetical protein
MTKAIEKHPIKIIFEKPNDFSIQSERSCVLNNIGFDKQRLFGEAVRYSLLHGKNNNFLELESPVNEIQDTIDRYYNLNNDENEEDNEVNARLEKLTDAVLSATVDEIASVHSVISVIPNVENMFSKISNDYGGNKVYDISLIDVKDNEDLGLLEFSLSIDVEVDL